MLSRFCLVLFLCSLVSPQSFAGKVKFVLLDIPPFGFYSQGKATAGVLGDVTKQLAKESGLEIETELVPFLRLATALSRGDAQGTFAFDLEMLKGRTEKIETPWLISTYLFYRSSDNLKSPEDFTSKMVGRIRGGCLIVLESPDYKCRFFDLVDFTMGIEMLETRRVDAVCAVGKEFGEQMQKNGIAKDHFKKYLVGTNKMYLHLAQKMNEGDRKKLLAGLKEMIKKGYFKTLEY